MLNDFFPAIVSIGVLVAVFLFACISDLRKTASKSPDPSLLPHAGIPVTDPQAIPADLD